MIMVGIEENLRKVFIKLQKSVTDKGLLIKNNETKVLRIGRTKRTQRTGE